MALSSVRHITRRVLRVALYLLLVGIVAFFALTRTQIGREQLADQLEHEFNSRYQGELRIDRLEGNLVRALYAGDVRLLDPEGRLVAHIDSLVLHPRWRDLFQRRITTGQLTVYRPRVTLHRSPEGRWNIEDAVERRPEYIPDPEAPPWRLTSAHVQLIDGTVTTENTGPPPRVVNQNFVFDYTDARLRGLNTEFHLDWTASPPQIDLASFSGALSDPAFQIQDAQGQLLLDDDGLTVSHLRLTSDSSQINLTGHVPDGLFGRGDPPGSVLVDLGTSQIDFSEWKRLFPRLPLANRAEVEAHIRGPISNLIIENFTVRRNDTEIRAEGSVAGLPDSVDFFVSLDANRAQVRDLEDVIPSVDLTRWHGLGRLEGTLTSRGLIIPDTDSSSGRLQTTATLNVRSGTAGRLAGTVEVDRRGSGQPHYEATLHADTLDLHRVLSNPILAGRVSGQLQLQGRGLDVSLAQTDARLRLQNSWLGGLPVDDLSLDLEADSGRVRGTARVNAGSGELTADIDAHLAEPDPYYTAVIQGREADLGDLLGRDSLSTRLNGVLTVQGSGLNWETAQGRATLQVDSSVVRYRQKTYPVTPNESELVLASDTSDAPRISLDGDAAAATITGDVNASLTALSRLWMQALQGAASEVLDKSYRQTADPLVKTETPNAEPLRTAAASLRPTLSDTVHTRLSFRIKQSDLFHALLPMLPRLPAGMTSELQMDASPDALQLSGTVEADSLRRGLLNLTHPHVAFSLSGGPADSLADALSGRLAFSSAAATLGGLDVPRPRFTVEHENRSSQMVLTSGAGQGPGPLHMTAALGLLEDRNSLTVPRLRIAGKDYVWSNADTARIDLYQDALVVPSLTLINPPSGAIPHSQRLNLAGTFSNAPTDTLYLTAQSVSLRELSELISLEHPVGGLAEGTLALTGPARRPVTTGGLSVNTLTFDDRVLGNLTLTAEHVAHQPDVKVDLSVEPGPEPASAPLPKVSASASGTAPLPLTPADSLYLAGINGPVKHEPNRLDVTGTLQLPSAGLDASEAGRFNLRVDMDRLDTFFLEYIFDKLGVQSGGYLQGGGRISGTFARPIFQLDTHLTDGRITIPRFSLQYEGNGPVRVDEHGVHLAALELTDPTGGRATIGGSIQFNDYNYLSLDLAATLEALQIMDTDEARDLPFYGSIWGSGDFSLAGPLSSASLRSTNARMQPKTEINIPINREDRPSDAGFIVFADSTGALPNLEEITRRTSVFADRPSGERPFMKGLDIDLNMEAMQGTTVHLVIDPLLGDVINAVGSGRLQLQRREGELSTYGTLNVSGGDYLFTAGELFFRRFLIEEGGTITWDGLTNNPLLNLTATYRTRASRAGLPERLASALPTTLPVIVQVNIANRLTSPQVNLDLAIDRSDRETVANYEGLETFLNQPERTAEYATSILLTNSFLLTTSLATQRETGDLASTRNRFAFSSISQLVGSQLNRYLSAAVPNLDVSFGLQGQNTEDLGVTYGVALRLLDERLIIRGEGAYQNEQTPEHPQGLEGEFVVEVRLTPMVSVEVFYRREDDLLATNLTNTTGAGLSYQTQFTTWRRLVQRLFGGSGPDEETDEPPPDASSAN